MKDDLLCSEGIIEKIQKASIEELSEYASEIRNYIIETVSCNGGHLASNLGTVELTLALYYVFDFPKKDVLVWDTGHQTYTHKILTNRAAQFKTIRKKNGLSGYTNIFESEYDSFGVGHVGTSIAAGLGFDRAKRLNGEPGEVISIIGDGALTSGNALEALNQVTGQNSKMKIIINDNGMSISDNVGSFANNLSLIRTSKGYNGFKKQMKSFLNETHLSGVEMLLEWMRDGLKNNLIPTSIFEAMGFKYLGPIDGHDIETLVRVFSNLKEGYKKPVVLHVYTRKGYGLDYAEQRPSKYHGIGPIERSNGQPKIKEDKLSYSDAFGYALSKYANHDEKLVAITSAMDIGTGLHHFKKLENNRFFDLGITEQSSLTFAGAMALKGFHPVYAVYSTFLQRAYDQIIHDIALQKIPLIVGIDRAGLVGSDGPTHHGTFDIAMLNPIPNVKIYTPSSITDLIKTLNYLINKAWNVDSSIFIRYPREKEDLNYKDIDQIISENLLKNPEKWDVFEKNQEMNTDYEIVVFAVGTLKNLFIKLSDEIKFPIKVVDTSSVKPFDRNTIDQVFNDNRKKILITAEEGIKIGGFGEHFISEIAKKNKRNIVESKIFAIEDFVTHGTRDELLKEVRLDYDNIKDEIEKMIDEHFI
jgi:1-deoxy-D-xylulose-5-phosphate synthase